MRRSIAAAVLAAVLLGSGSMMLAARSPAAAPAGPEVERGLVGALLHSRWLHSGAPLSVRTLAEQAEAQGLEVMPVGLPLGDAASRQAAPAALASWLKLTPGIASIPSLNTFALPADQQDAAGLEALFGRVAPVVRGRAEVQVVAGANEPLTLGKGWPSAAEAEARVRLEYRAWHEVSDEPFCHKFTNPRINVAGADWALMERLWAEAQDAICYDWYASSGDTLATLDHLRALGQQLDKPVHVLETAVPGNDPGMLREMAARVDTIAVYQWLSLAGGEDERLACYVLHGQEWQARAPAGMLRAVLGRTGGPAPRDGDGLGANVPGFTEPS